MKHGSIFLTTLLVLLKLCCTGLWAEPTTADQAEKVVKGWLKTDPQPLDTALGGQVRRVETFTNDSGEPIYYIVYLQPSGFVIVPADDLVEPIIGFVPQGPFNPSLDNPLGALVTNDLNSRIKAVRDSQKLQATAAAENALESQAKWEELESLAEASKELETTTTGLPSVSDPRVDPLLRTKWGQTTCCNSPPLACYNYYTPPSDPCDPCDYLITSNPPSPQPYGSPGNYPCGCIATAMAQLMRYHTYPNLGIGKQKFTIWVDGWSQDAWTRGGNGLGGPYNWALMVYEPNCNTTVAQRQAIGALCYDAGVSVSMSYSATCSWAFPWDADTALTDVFDYNNCIYGNNWSGIGAPNLMDMVNPNLDYNHPVILNLTAPGQPEEFDHAVIADGYGYQLSTLYHHLNMGWEGQNDAWYNLPYVLDYNCVNACIYNIFITGDGEIISGRVTDAYGIPLSGVTLTAQGPSGPYNAATNAGGIYALGKVRSASTYTVSAAKTGYKFAPKSVTTGTSIEWTATTGNRWAVDFQALPPRFYVDANATGSNDGRSWANAYNHLQDALAGLCPDVIWVAKGTYYPDCNSANPSGSGSRTATFQLKSGVAIYGGFAGGETSLNQRDPTANVTILSGDIGTPGNNSDNSYHVVTGSGTDPTAILDGFTITEGNADGSTPYDRGAGMYNNAGNPTVANCTFTANSATLFGGGMYNESASPTLSNCTFAGNSAGLMGGGMCNWLDCSPMLTDCNFSTNSAIYFGAGMFNISSNPTLTDCSFSTNSAAHGGGMFNNGSNPMLTNCTFSGNSALDSDKGGGAIYNEASSPMVTNCTFTGNSAEYAGGGMYNESSNPTISNCAFSDNSANNYGGGMYNIRSDYLTLTNCTFSHNWAILDGGGMYSTDSDGLTLINCTSSGNSAINYGGGIFQDGGDIIFLVNCILWGNTANFGPQIALLNTDMLIAFSDVQGGEASIYKENSSIMYGPFNIEADPMFVDANDFHLLPDSPCIDAGDNGSVPGGVTTDLDGHPRFVDGDCNDTVIVDMGAYEFNYAYMGDFDYDCDVDFPDFAIFALAWLTQPGDDNWNCFCDISIPADNYIDWWDLDVLSDNWLASF